jgi:hypothetical protein
MPAAKADSWAFRSRFRAGAFGWRSDLPIKRIAEAVAEIRKAARKDAVLAAEGAVTFLEKVSGDLTAQDVVDAFNHTLEAARRNGTEADTLRSIQLLVDQHPAAELSVATQLRRRLDELTRSSAT